MSLESKQLTLEFSVEILPPTPGSAWDVYEQRMTPLFGKLFGAQQNKGGKSYKEV